ncbi:MAG: maleylacetate reductase [Flavobacteriia bacterium]|nr:maleylacetate reductase [Flavobacteriia bacterium]
MNESHFEWKSLPVNVLFGQGRRAELKNIVNQDEAVFVIASTRLANEVENLKSTLASANSFVHFDKVEQHVPEELINEALALYEAKKCSHIIAMGGGSAIGLAKAIALKLSATITAIPTTYSGSEMTNIWGYSKKGEGKTTGRDNRVMPKTVIYDSELTIGMPFQLAAKSALNALAHLMEGVYAHDGNPITYNNSLYGIECIMNGLRILISDGKLASDSNDKLFLGAFLAGKSLCEVSMSLHHKTAHVLGGSFGLEHALVHSIMQAYVLEYQWPYLNEKTKGDFREALNHSYPPLALHELVKQLGIPSSLTEIGFKLEDIEVAVEVMLKNPYANPAPLSREGLVVLLANASKGVLKGED